MDFLTQYNLVFAKYEKDSSIKINNIKKYKKIVCDLSNGKPVNKKDIDELSSFLKQSEADESVLISLKEKTDEILLKIKNSEKNIKKSADEIKKEKLNIKK